MICGIIHDEWAAQLQMKEYKLDTEFKSVLGKFDM